MLNSSFCIDWLSFTLKVSHLEELEPRSVERFMENLGLMELPCEPEYRERGRYGYNRSITFDDKVNVLYNYFDRAEEVSFSKQDRILRAGIHIEFTGQGCRLFENSGFMSWREYFQYLNSINVVYSRLDIAMDDYEGLLDFDLLEDKIKNGEVLSTSRKKEIDDGIQFNKQEKFDNKGHSLGKTLYFGTRQSEFYLRLYDKKAEQEQKKIKVEYDVWQRYEMVLKKDRASDFINRYVNGAEISDLYLGILKQNLRFVDRDKGQKNKSRWPISQFWSDFLKNVESVKLESVLPETNISKTIDWFDSSVVNSLLMLKRVAEMEGVNLLEHLDKIDKELPLRQQNTIKMFDSLPDSEKQMIKQKMSLIGIDLKK